MRVFKCVCSAELFFENTSCLNCGRLAGFCDETERVMAFDPAEQTGQFTAQEDTTSRYRQCDNYLQHQVCNGMVRIAEGQSAETAPRLCFACHFNNTIPNLSVPEHLPLWRKMEAAKRRAIFTIKALGLKLPDRAQDSNGGLQFRFVADKDARDHFTSRLPNQATVYTGHNNGVITLNLAEADDVARANAQLSLGENYRTLLGHFRHEMGHFYWDKLIQGNQEAENDFRALFGDEREDYQNALDRHYKQGPPQAWQKEYISAYATVHPWEDWAETWAHYMHLLDTLETAQDCGVQFRSSVAEDEQTVVADLNLPQQTNYFNHQTPVDKILDTWMQFSVVLNSLNRSMGLPDAYPFVLTQKIRQKLKFVHAVVHGRGKGQN